MKTIVFLIFCLLIFVSSLAAQVPVNLIEDPVELVYKIGDNLSRKFRLIKPTHPAINSKGEIFVFDVDKIKIFGPAGDEKQTIENSRRTKYFLPAPYTSSISTNYDNYFYVSSSLFSPEKEFLLKIGGNEMIREPFIVDFLKENNLVECHAGGLFPIDENRFILGCNIKDDEYYPFNMLGLYINNDKVNIIYNFRIKTEIQVSGHRAPIFLDSFKKIVIKNDKLAYIKKADDLLEKDGESFYRINIIDLQGELINQIVHPYEKTPYPEGYNKTEEKQYTWFINNFPESKDVYERAIEINKSIKYQHVINRFYSDNEYLFVQLNKKNEAGEALFDIFDTNTAKYLSSAYLPLWPKIRDGYLYRKQKTDNGSYVIEKYRINPAVYGK
ncbi:hypothetical protein ACFL7D_02465 [candidate division KSB1 bacterium]